MTAAPPEPRVSIAEPQHQPAQLYLDLLKRTLTRYAFPERYRPRPPARTRAGRRAGQLLDAILGRRGLALVSVAPVDLSRRAEGRDWPAEAETMIGLRRLDNIEQCVTTVLREGVPGDLMETGVWRGGASIFMRAILEAYGDEERTVWAADSFQGLPKPDPRYPQDGMDVLWSHPELAVSLDAVRRNFARYGLLDDRVRFLVGWFADTLPSAPVERLAVLRLDGDMYQSTMDALDHLYDRLSPGGFLIVDDFEAAPNCEAAIADFRARRGITDPIVRTDWTGAYWRKT